MTELRGRPAAVAGGSPGMPCGRRPIALEVGRARSINSVDDLRLERHPGPVDPDVDIRLNQIAQGRMAREDGALWFSTMPEDERRDVLRRLGAMIVQAHPGPDEVSAAIAGSGLRPTLTPAVMLGKAPLMQSVYRIANLGRDEQPRAFLLLTSLLGTADAARRRRDCGRGCNHWWHHLEADIQNDVP